PAGAARRPGLRLGPALPAGRLYPPAAAQPVLPVAVSDGSAGKTSPAALRMIQGHLVLFVRAPRWGVGKRRLARDIGDAAALRFERAMLGLLARRLGRDGRWRLRLAVTPDRACRRARLRPSGVAVAGQGAGGLGRGTEGGPA